MTSLQTTNSFSDKVQNVSFCRYPGFFEKSGFFLKKLGSPQENVVFVILVEMDAIKSARRKCA